MEEAGIIAFINVDDDTLLELRELCVRQGMQWIVYLNALYDKFNPRDEENRSN